MFQNLRQGLLTMKVPGGTVLPLLSLSLSQEKSVAGRSKEMIEKVRKEGTAHKTWKPAGKSAV